MVQKDLILDFNLYLCEKFGYRESCSVMPHANMLMLTAAFGDYDYTMHAYNVALKEDYKFGPYGDVMLIID